MKPDHPISDFSNHCFVCGREIDTQNTLKNVRLNLPVCTECNETEQEKRAVNELLEGMADGFVCGCI
jgi:ribosome-binding protein aMBF1 (putative translation factor)